MLQCLAVDSDILPFKRLLQFRRPGIERSHKLLFVYPGKDSSEGVMAGDAILQIKACMKEIETFRRDKFDVFPTVGTTNDSVNGNSDHIGKIMFFCPVDPGVADSGRSLSERKKIDVHQAPRRKE